MKRYRLTYVPSPGMEPVVWEKTADELLMPNGEVPLIVWMYLECAQHGVSAPILEERIVI